MRRFSILAVGLAMWALCAQSVNADFRCKGKRVNDLSSFDVLSLCGEPEYKDQFMESSAHGNCVDTRIWYYVSSASKRSVSVTFRRGKVVHVDEGIIRTNRN